ncbi:MAG TPA: ABC transporter substrate-binding protein, partial [Ardenticatenaceae bacterium]|nr:ABC transporter substrate-binding protein [Ardenticatenaceae bacterium]
MLLSSVRRGLIPVLLALFLVSAGCRAEAPREVPQSLDVSVQVPNPTLDPQRDVTGASTTITQQLFAGLMRLDPATAEALPDLAVEPPAVSADGLTYTFVLRQDAIWVDQGGRPMAPITVDDVVFTIRRLCDNQTDPRLALLFS